MISIPNRHLLVCLVLAAAISSAGTSLGQLINVNFTGVATADTRKRPCRACRRARHELEPIQRAGLPGHSGRFHRCGHHRRHRYQFRPPGHFRFARDQPHDAAGLDDQFGKGVDNTNVTISGLEAGGIYDIWLVTLRNQPFTAANGTEQYVGWWSTTNTTLSPSSQLVDARGASINTSTFVAGYNYVLFDNVVANGSGQIIFTGVAGPLIDGSNNNHRLGLNGLQIQEADAAHRRPGGQRHVHGRCYSGLGLRERISASTVTVTLRDANGIRRSEQAGHACKHGRPAGRNHRAGDRAHHQLAGQAGFSVRSNTVGTDRLHRHRRRPTP